MNQSKPDLPNSHRDNFHHCFVQTLAHVNQRGSSLAHFSQEKSCNQAQEVALLGSTTGAASVKPSVLRVWWPQNGGHRAKPDFVQVAMCSYKSRPLFQANTRTWLVFLAFSYKAPPDPNPGFGLFLAQKTDKLHCCSMLEESFPGVDKLD